jgi:hypothetical protein
MGSQNNVFSTATRSGQNDPGFDSSGKRFFFSPKHPYQIWGLPASYKMGIFQDQVVWV